ncbi:MAG TPA: IS110 family transposase [Vicinamibacterales bacterium]|nr:IS110 family transposase [Vicinamibacterales bacterium]
MEYGAIDLHTRRSQVRIVAEEGTVVLDRRIDTTRSAFASLFGDGAPMRILLEASTEAEWVAQHLEALGHSVIVGDPNYTLMYGQRTRRIKTDKRDAAALAEACRLGIYRAAHRVSPGHWRERQQQTVRQQIVRQRTALINVCRALLRQEGYRLPAGEAENVVARLDRVELSAPLTAVLEPVRALLHQLTATLRELDAAARVRAQADPIVRRLMTAPGVGPVVALTFRAVLDTPARFGGDAQRVAAFVGLVPREASSAERHRKGHITKAGPPIVRSLLVPSAWMLWRSRRPEVQAIRAWADALAARRGRRIAVVAVARRLCRMLYAMWRDGTVFHPRVAAAA